MTAPRRALPAAPTALQRLAARLTQDGRHDSLVSALEDHLDRLEQRAREYGPTNYYGQLSAELAYELRHILQEHT